MFRVPCVVLREVTERPETVERGGTVLSGVEPEAMARAVRAMRSAPRAWTAPPEYLAPAVSATAARIVLGPLAG